MSNITTYNEIRLDMLTETSVSVLNTTYADINGIKAQIGSNVRKAYGNSAHGRKMLAAEVPEPYLSTVLTLWGPEPTLLDPPMPAAPEVSATEPETAESIETETSEGVEVADTTEPDEVIEGEEVPDTATEPTEVENTAEPATEPVEGE